MRDSKLFVQLDSLLVCDLDAAMPRWWPSTKYFYTDCCYLLSRVLAICSICVLLPLVQLLSLLYAYCALVYSSQIKTWTWAWSYYALCPMHKTRKLVYCCYRYFCYPGYVNVLRFRRFMLFYSMKLTTWFGLDALWLAMNLTFTSIGSLQILEKIAIGLFTFTTCKTSNVHATCRL